MFSLLLHQPSVFTEQRARCVCLLPLTGRSNNIKFSALSQTNSELMAPNRKSRLNELTKTAPGIFLVDSFCAETPNLKTEHGSNAAPSSISSGSVSSNQSSVSVFLIAVFARELLWSRTSSKF